MKNIHFGVILCGVLLLAGCKSLSTPFTYSAPKYDDIPVDSLRVVAQDIESAIRAGNKEPNLEARGGVILDTPEIRQAIRSRAARIEILDDLLVKGHSYEQANGLVHIVRTKEYKNAYTRQEKDRDALLVMGENNNRWSIYEGILNSNEYPGGSISAIQKIFFDARVALLPSGVKYEDENGNIVSK